MSDGMLQMLRRDFLRLKILAIVITLVALVEAFVLVAAVAVATTNKETMELMRENISLRGEMASLHTVSHEQTRQLCSVQLRMGDGYRRVLLNLVERFGLDKKSPQTITNALLEEFERLGVRTGMGGP